MNSNTVILIIVFASFCIPIVMFGLSKIIPWVLEWVEKSIPFDNDIIQVKLSNSDMSISDITDNLKITNSLFDKSKKSKFTKIG